MFRLSICFQQSRLLRAGFFKHLPAARSPRQSGPGGMALQLLSCPAHELLLRNGPGHTYSSVKKVREERRNTNTRDRVEAVNSLQCAEAVGDRRDIS
ncbi:hypothetical protein Q8A67_020481 [Cirrhinus molitorella]|uniref:Uncharacterized protein n=1 Tax=Cirrhinus molitorella TaxID=172907 RepID=A0AA88PJN2_9TELE|nr:hypothetical protein Q8A67_020481 [Cirrhinus molitorella]